MGASPAEWAATMKALGPLVDAPLIRPHVHQDKRVVDWFEISFGYFSKGENKMIALAETLYRGSYLVHIMDLIEEVDDESWQRCIEALVIRRGIPNELHIQPGQYVETVG